VRARYHFAKALSFWNSRKRHASWTMPFRTLALPARASPFSRRFVPPSSGDPVSQLELLQSRLLNLADLLGNELLACQVALHFGQRVGRDRLALRRAHVFRALRRLLELGIEAADAEPRRGRLDAVDDGGVLPTRVSRSRCGRLASSSAKVGMAARTAQVVERLLLLFWLAHRWVPSARLLTAPMEPSLV
jgi:hypothetical protein